MLTNADDRWVFVDGVEGALTEDYYDDDDDDDDNDDEDSRLYVHAATAC